MFRSTIRFYFCAKSRIGAKARGAPNVRVECVAQQAPLHASSSDRALPV
jgi:hypothetical protein